MRPGPVATLMMNGMPANARFMPPASCITVSGTCFVLPQHDVVLEEDGVAGAEVDFGHGHDLAFHLAGAGAEVDLRHVLDPRRFAPARFADQIANVERRSAGPARERGFVVHALAPLALDALQGFSGGLWGLSHVQPLVVYL